MAFTIKNLSRMNHEVRRGSVTVGDVVYLPGGVCGPRIQRDYQMVVVHRGILNLQLDKETINVPANYGILLPPNHREQFRFSTDQETQHSWCAIQRSSVPAWMQKEFRVGRGPAPFLGRMATLWDMGRSKSAVRGGDKVLQHGFYLGLGLAVMCEFAITVRTVKPPDASDAVLLRMENVIRDKYAQPLSLEVIARAAGVSRQHLLKLCRLRGKPTAMQQLYLKRLETSAELLLHTGLSINEIADRSGFVNIFHFSRKFKQAYGHSPLAWRKGLWKDDPRRTSQ